MAEHNSIYGRDIIQGVLMKMSSCISELLSQGNPTKKQYIKKVTPLEDWIAEQKAQNP